MTPTEILRTVRLTLTSWSLEDVDGLLAVHADPETMRYVRNGRPETRDEVATLIRSYMAEERRTGVTKWRLTDQTDRIVGRAGFGADDGGRELGYTIWRDLWGKGLASEIARALVAWHRENACDIPLWGYVAEGNPASARVLRKVGFVPQGIAHHHGVPCRVHRLPPSNACRQAAPTDCPDLHTTM